MAKRITTEQLQNLDNLIVNLTQEDKLNTELDYPFNVELKVLTRTENINLQRKFANEEGEIDVALYSKELFRIQVVSWNGLFENEHQENIPATDDFKDRVYESPLFNYEVEMILAKLLEIKGDKTKKEDDIKKKSEEELNTTTNTENIVENVPQ